MHICFHVVGKVLHSKYMLGAYEHRGKYKKNGEEGGIESRVVECGQSRLSGFHH